jgi:uroporphyrinogen-III decarboxylase
LYRTFVWPLEKRLIDNIHALGAPVRLHICGNTRPLLADLGKLGADMIDLDYFSPVDEARAAMGPEQVLAGNINPVTVLRNGTPDGVRAAVEDCRDRAGHNYIIAAGCEIPRDTPPQNVHALRACSRTS